MVKWNLYHKHTYTQTLVHTVQCSDEATYSNKKLAYNQDWPLQLDTTVTKRTKDKKNAESLSNANTTSSQTLTTASEFEWLQAMNKAQQQTEMRPASSKLAIDSGRLSIGWVIGMCVLNVYESVWLAGWLAGQRWILACVWVYTTKRTILGIVLTRLFAVSN